MQVGLENDLPVVNAVDCEGRFVAEVTPWAGRFVKDADPDIIAELKERGLLLGVEAYDAQLPLLLALRHAAALLREADLVHPHHGDQGPAPRRQRRRRLAPRAHQARAASASGSRTTSTGPSAATATGARRCPSGAAPQGTRTAWAASPSCARWPLRPVPDDLELHRPYVDDVVLRCPECGGDMRRVAEVIDAWFDSGSMPFAQWHYPFENEDALPRALPGRLHLRGHRPDARLVLQPHRRGHARSRGAARTSAASAWGTSSTARARR